MPLVVMLIITKGHGGKLYNWPINYCSNTTLSNKICFFSVWPDEDSYPALEKMTRRVQHITGLLSSSKLRESDNFMCGNYGIGGHYGVHPDYHKYNAPTGVW